jgi:hypothetical protein
MTCDNVNNLVTGDLPNQLQRSMGSKRLTLRLTRTGERDRATPAKNESRSPVSGAGACSARDLGQTLATQEPPPMWRFVYAYPDVPHPLQLAGAQTIATAPD